MDETTDTGGSQFRRRAFLGTALVGGVVGSAGCLGLFGSCEGDTSIEEKAANPADYYTTDDLQLIGVIGEVGSVTRDRVILDDGTGTAAITSGPISDWQTGSADFDCAEGSGSYLQDMQSQYDADLVLFGGTVTQHNP